MIMGILASVAVTVYTGHVDRARVAACRDTIRQLELAVNQYEVDTGQYPPPSSGLPIAPDDLLYEGNATQGSFGCGYLQLALMHSLSGNLYEPLHYRWLGPYIELDEDQVGDRFGLPVTASTPKGYVQILDPWGSPYYYLRTVDYASLGGTEYPTDHPFYSTETYYNPSTFQIFSMGRNGTTYSVPYRGEETDDVNNWRRYGRRLGASGGGGGGRSRKIAQTSPSGHSGDGDRVVTIQRNNQSSSSPGSMRRMVNMTFSLPDNSNLLFRWPEGWKKGRGGEVTKPSEEDIKPRWLFKSAGNVSFESISARFKQMSDAELIFEGPDPTQTLPGCQVLETRSKNTPDLDLQKDAEGKPYHLVVMFKQGAVTCWWASNFSTYESMEEGRLFITGIVRTKTPVVKSAR